MQTSNQPLLTPKWMTWTGIIIGLLPILMMITGGLMSLLNPKAVGEAMAKMGYPESIGVYLGVIELLCSIIYLIPRTSVFGAILLTGYLGGATATHVRIGESFLFPIFAGVLIWGGIYLRDSRLRQLIPLRRLPPGSTTSR